jgi:hypothetical protein
VTTSETTLESNNKHDLAHSLIGRLNTTLYLWDGSVLRVSICAREHIRPCE